MRNFLIYLTFFLFFNLSYLKSEDLNLLKDYETINLDGSINVVIEIPAGNNIKKSLSEDGFQIINEYKSDKIRKVNYLPYPFNYGFLPRTLESFDSGADGDPLDVILLGNRSEEGLVIKAKAIGVIVMNDNGERDNKILATSFDEIFYKINNISDLKKSYPGILEIIKIWLKNYKGGFIQIIEVKGKKSSLEYINKSMSSYKIKKK